MVAESPMISHALAQYGILFTEVIMAAAWVVDTLYQEKGKSLAERQRLGQNQLAMIIQ